MARMRVCACIGCTQHDGSCPELSEARRCPACALDREHQRGTKQQRGYGAAHDAAKARLLRTYVPGDLCPKCGKGMWDPRTLDAGHSRDLREHPDAIADQLEHRGCNRAWRRAT